MSEGVPSPHPVRTTCPYCGVGCGVLATPDGTGGAAMAGDPEHPANFGALCVKGAALGETLKTDSRLTTPLIDRLPTTWPRAIRRAADMLRETAQRHGPESIAFYLSGQLLTEDYYVANKLAKGFIGTPHVDTNSRLCMASSVAGHRRAFGADVVPNAYADLDLADLVVLVGSNAAWCHPVLYRRMQAAREARGTRLIVIDPRRTATAEGADLHLPIAPGMDGVLWSHLLVEIDRRGAVDADFRDRHTSGYAEALAGARAIAPDAATAAARCGLTPADLARFVDLWIGTDRVVSAYSQGVNQSAQGTDKVNAILNCHLATGRIGKPGCGPFSLTGQPNAMGGREVGGLANMLAAHMGFSPAERERVAGFWQAPNLVTGEGLKAVDMFEAVADGRIKALWVMCTNPAVSLPRADAVRGALRRLDALIVSESHAGIDGLLEGAHVAFPAAPGGRTEPSPIPSGASPASAPSCRSMARRGPTGASSATSRPNSASARPSPTRTRPKSSASMRPCRRSTIMVPALSISAASLICRTAPTTRLRRCNGRSRKAQPSGANGSSPRVASSRPMAGRGSSRSRRRVCMQSRTRIIRYG